jgi:hypothetical protein
MNDRDECMLIVESKKKFINKKFFGSGSFKLNKQQILSEYNGTAAGLSKKHL